ncbi:gephyrin-like molybdotransferase Glp [Streptomyces sp. SID3343]|uniref:molybdotransferase-like divisome protein Glp n=1 Tax=Streptomyces sp. SID3343 TaxID=2690260 RepID=UPI001369F274|nr:gephyrin-like molybdotransferase Glp [Streptomyces sp. SID3343]MYV97371.1 molybdopterin molybdenumtransferase MoeA [Streptomyces sp. SID3343]
MKSVEDHLTGILERIEPLAPLELQLLDAHGSLLVDEVASTGDLPPFDNSSMDGYAVRLADVADASERYPVVLDVVDDIAAGNTADTAIGSGTCARIMTGAPIPEGTEAIVPVEWTDAGMPTVRITKSPSKGQYIRLRGSDVTAGQTVLAAGAAVGSAQVGLLAAIGRDRIRVRPKPRVVILSTGSELTQPGRPIGPGRIRDSNSYMLTAAAREAGAIAYRVGNVPDDPKILIDTIEDQLIRADVVVTTGGVSAGAYDVVKEVLSELGTVEFGKVAMQPGMPQGFGVIGPDETPIFTLPGNPVSAFVSFEVFVRPALLRMQGAEVTERPVVRATCVSALTSPDGKRQFLRAWYTPPVAGVGEGVVEPVGGTGSHLLGSLARANALISLPAEVTEVAEGGDVDVMLLS